MSGSRPRRPDAWAVHPRAPAERGGCPSLAVPQNHVGVAFRENKGRVGGGGPALENCPPSQTEQAEEPAVRVGARPVSTGGGGCVGGLRKARTACGSSPVKSEKVPGGHCLHDEAAGGARVCGGQGGEKAAAQRLVGAGGPTFLAVKRGAESRQFCTFQPRLFIHAQLKRVTSLKSVVMRASVLQSKGLQ